MKYDRNVTNEEIIEAYRKFCYQLGKIASTTDVRSCDYMCSVDKIRDIFGSWKNFVELSGVCKNGEPVGMPLKETVEQVLVDKRIKYGRRLDRMEFNSNNNLPGFSYVQRLYDGKSLNEIWSKIEKDYNITDISKYDLLQGIKRI